MTRFVCGLMIPGEPIPPPLCHPESDAQQCHPVAAVPPVFLCRLRRYLELAQYLAVFIYKAGFDLGTAQINPDGRLHGFSSVK